MTNPLPDTDPLKREPPGEVSKVPDNDVGGGGRPAGKPDEQGGAATGGQEGNIHPSGEAPTNH